jgi:hypothetical protein
VTQRGGIRLIRSWDSDSPYYIDYGPALNGSKLPENYASLDKIDPSKGYVIGNLQVISKKANAMKSNATIEELRLFVKNITARMF